LLLSDPGRLRGIVRASDNFASFFGVPPKNLVLRRERRLLMLNLKLLKVTERALWRAGSMSAAERRRRDARLFITLAERHIARGDSDQLAATLVRAAWRAHEEADAEQTETERGRRGSC
jgi:hypothetical protein